MALSEEKDDDLPKRLDKETINELPLIRFHGAINVAEDSKSLDKEVKSKDDLDQKEAEDNNLQSEDGKAGLSQAKDLNTCRLI